MALSDPFYPVRDEVVAELNELQGLYSRWRDLVQNPSSSGNEEFEWVTQEVESILLSTETDLKELEECVGAANRDRDRFSLSESELFSRKSFLRSTRQKIDDIRSQWSRSSRLVEERSRQRLLREKEKRPARPDRAVEIETQEFVDGSQVRQQQDVELEDLSRTVGTLGEMGEQIGETLSQQQGLIEDLESGVERTQVRVKKMTQRVKDLAKRKSHTIQVIIIIFLIFVLAIVAVLAISSFFK